MNGSPGTIVSVLELLLIRAHKLVVVGLVVFFMGPTCLVAFLVWRMVDRQDRAMDLIMNSVVQHSIDARRDHDTLQKTIDEFIQSHRARELTRDALLFEICMIVQNDGPGRSRCRQAIGQ